MGCCIIRYSVMNFHARNMRKTECVPADVAPKNFQKLFAMKTVHNIRFELGFQNYFMFCTLGKLHIGDKKLESCQSYYTV